MDDGCQNADDSETDDFLKGLFVHPSYTVSIKLRSVRLKMTTAKNRVISINTVLYKSPPQSKEPQPMQLYLKVSKMGVRGFMAMMCLYCSGAALNG